MALDIMKWLSLYILVLFAFGCGMNQLLWYYADLEYEKCYSLPGGLPNLKGEVPAFKAKVVKPEHEALHAFFSQHSSHTMSVCCWSVWRDSIFSFVTLHMEQQKVINYRFISEKNP